MQFPSPQNPQNINFQQPMPQNFMNQGSQGYSFGFGQEYNRDAAKLFLQSPGNSESLFQDTRKSQQQQTLGNRKKKVRRVYS